jgi:CheY-like chemotaxis protein
MDLASAATILLAEDNEDDVVLTQRAFKRARVINPLQVVRDGQAVLEYLEGRDAFGDRKKFPIPCLILLDLHMPRKNGFEVLQWIRAHQTFKRLLVVVLTSSRVSPDINKAYDLGANSYLVKRTADELIEMLRGLQGYWLFLNQPPQTALR